MIIKKLTVGAGKTNCYILIDKHTKKGILIDPGAEVEKILKVISKKKWNIQYILLTHSHFDHLGVSASIQKEKKIPVYLHRNDFNYISKELNNKTIKFGSEFITLPECEILEGNETLKLGNTTIEVISTPGHTIGGVCYYLREENLLFSGDTLFYRSIGSTNHGGSFSDLVKSIKNNLMALHDKTKVYPGHGPSTTIGYERLNNKFLE